MLAALNFSTGTERRGATTKDVLLNIDDAISALRAVNAGDDLTAREGDSLGRLLSILLNAEDVSDIEERAYADGRSDGIEDGAYGTVSEEESERLIEEARVKGYNEGRKDGEKAVRDEWNRKANDPVIQEISAAAQGRIVGKDLAERGLVDRGYLRGDVTRARELRLDVRRSLGTSSDPAPTAIQALNALRAMAALVDVASGRTLGAGVVYNGHLVPTGDVIRAYTVGHQRERDGR